MPLYLLSITSGQKKKKDCCSFPLKRILPPLRIPQYPNFVMPYSQTCPFWQQSFLLHQFLNAVAFDNKSLKKKKKKLRVSLPDNCYDIVPFLVLIYISNWAYTGFFYILSSLLLTFPSPHRLYLFIFIYLSVLGLH